MAKATNTTSLGFEEKIWSAAENEENFYEETGKVVAMKGYVDMSAEDLYSGMAAEDK